MRRVIVSQDTSHKLYVRYTVYTSFLANIVTTAAPLLNDSLATAFPIPLLPPVICINRHIATHRLYTPHILECVSL